MNDHMTSVRIGNGVLETTVSTLGAELQSLRRLADGIELLWQGDPASWPRRAPVLFPIVGRLRGDRFLWRGREYRLPQHGFARDRVFDLAAHDATSATFVLADDTETRRSFPFSFHLAVSYRVAASTLATTFEITNPGPDELLFSFGGHPGLRCPPRAGERFEDYSLTFEMAETGTRLPVVDGLIGSPPQPLLANQRELPLSRDLFADGALVFSNLRSTWVRLANRHTGRGVEMAFAEFPYLGIWSRPPGEFVCLEPWCGIADPTDATGQLEDKEGIVRLRPAQGFRRTFEIRVDEAP